MRWWEGDFVWLSKWELRDGGQEGWGREVLVDVTAF